MNFVLKKIKLMQFGYNGDHDYFAKKHFFQIVKQQLLRKKKMHFNLICLEKYYSIKKFIFIHYLFILQKIL